MPHINHMTTSDVSWATLVLNLESQALELGYNLQDLSFIVSNENPVVHIHNKIVSPW